MGHPVYHDNRSTQNRMKMRGGAQVMRETRSIFDWLFVTTIGQLIFFLSISNSQYS